MSFSGCHTGLGIAAFTIRFFTVLPMADANEQCITQSIAAKNKL
jgi:hypothetical protein